MNVTKLNSQALILLLFAAFTTIGDVQDRIKRSEEILNEYEMKNTAMIIGSDLMNCHNKSLQKPDQIIRQFEFSQNAVASLKDKFNLIQERTKTTQRLDLVGIKVFTSSVFAMHFIGSNEDGPYGILFQAYIYNDTFYVHDIVLETDVITMGSKLSYFEKLPAPLTLTRK